MSTTGERLKERRKQMELSADDVASELGVSRSTIFRYENGYIEKVPANILERLSDILHTTPAYLMGWDDDPDDWERTANELGICSPNDFDGEPEDWYKMKMAQEQDALIDKYYDTHPDEDINEPFREDLPHNIRSAARDMMELSEDDQELAINMIRSLAAKGRKANKD